MGIWTIEWGCGKTASLVENERLNEQHPPLRRRASRRTKVCGWAILAEAAEIILFMTNRRRAPSDPASLIALMLLSLATACAQTTPASIDMADSPIPIHVLAESPAETNADLQVICLFRSSPRSALHGSLVEMNEKLNGLLDRIRQPQLFRGELGETLLIKTPLNQLRARRLLIIGLVVEGLFENPRQPSLPFGDPSCIMLPHGVFVVARQSATSATGTPRCNRIRAKVWRNLWGVGLSSNFPDSSNTLPIFRRHRSVTVSSLSD